MHLTASIQPPDEALKHLRVVLGNELADSTQIAWEHPSRLRVRLADFGIVVRDDAARVAENLTERVAQLGAPTLRLQELRPLPLDGDDSIWVGLGGDADVLSELASAIPRWAHEMGFVPDRRAYYNGIRLGRVTPATTVSYLEDLATRFGGYEGPAWTAHELLVGIEKLAGPDHPPGFSVFESAPFADEPIERQGGAHVQPVSGQHL